MALSFSCTMCGWTWTTLFGGVDTHCPHCGEPRDVMAAEGVSATPALRQTAADKKTVLHVK